LDEAVQTMRRGEEAQFLISYKLLYGELGCQPRIPAKADGLFIIKLLKFSEIGDIDAIEKLPAEERNDFATVYEKAQEVIKNGKAMFQRGDIFTAIKAFHKSAESLALCRLKDEQEQTRQVEMLLRLYLNMAVCYNKQNLPAKACLMCTEIRRLCEITNNCKALFQEGRAHLKLGEFGKAKRALTRCQQLEPRNKEIGKELKLLAVKSESYDKERIAFSQRAMQSIRLSEDSKEPVPAEPVLDFEVLHQQLTNFKNGSNDRLELPDSLSSAEIELLESMLVGELAGIEFKIMQIGNRKLHTLVKKARY
jgi:FK506-binding protein 6